MDLSKLLRLSRYINHSTPRSIKKLVSSIDELLVKQIIKTYLNFLLNNQNRNNHINNHDYQILNSIQHELNKKHKKNSFKYAQNTFDKLPLLLTSYLLSFCDQNSVNNASKTCHTLYYASNQSMTISQISKIFKKNKISK